MTDYPMGEIKRRDMERLVELGREAPGQVLVEIGTAQGLTAAGLAQAAGKVVLSIDPDPQIMRARPLPPRVLLLRMTSTEAAVALDVCELGMVFVDGCHCRMCVRLDLRLWTPRLAPGGILACHDIRQEGRRLYRPHKGEMHRDRTYGVEAAIAEWGAAGFTREPWDGNMAILRKETT